MKIYSYLIFICVILSSGSCEKEPAPATNPDGILHCKINGQYWEAYDFRENDGDPFGWGPGSTNLQYYSSTKFFEISAKREFKDNSILQGFTFFVNNVKKGNNRIEYRRKAFSDLNNPSTCISYDIDSVYNNLIIITEIDSVKYKMKGNFELHVINACMDTLNITEGYFNLKYQF